MSLFKKAKSRRDLGNSSSGIVTITIKLPQEFVDQAWQRTKQSALPIVVGSFIGLLAGTIVELINRSVSFGHISLLDCENLHSQP